MASYIKNLSFVLAAQFVIMAFGLLSKPIVARLLGPSEYGLFALVLATASIVPAIAVFSLNQAVLYFTAKNERKSRSILYSALGLVFALSLLFFPIFYLAVTYLVPSIGFYGMLVSYLIGFGTSILLVAQAHFQGLEKFKDYALITAATSVFAAVFSLTVAYFFRGFVETSAARMIPLLIVPFGALYLAKSLGFSLKEAKSLLKYALPIGLSGLLGVFIAIADRYIIAIFKTPADVGFYDVAYSFTAAVLPITATLATTIAPRFVKQSTKTKEYLEKVSSVTAAIGACGAIVLFYYADFFVSILLGASYVEGATTPLRIVALALPLMALVSVYGTIVASLGSSKFAGLISVLLVALSIAFNLLLVPQFSAIGAAYANLFTYALTVFAIMGFFFLKNKFIPKSALFTYLVLALFAATYWLLGITGFIEKTLIVALFTAIVLYLNLWAVRIIWDKIMDLITVSMPWKK